MSLAGGTLAVVLLPSDASGAAITLFVIAVVLVVGVQLVVHELAHFIFGALVGLRLDGLIIGNGPALLVRVRPDRIVALRILLTRGFVPAGVKPGRRLHRAQLLAFQLGPWAIDLTILAVALAFRPGSDAASVIRAALVGGSAVLVASGFHPNGDWRRALGEIRRDPDQLAGWNDPPEFKHIESLRELPMKRRLSELRRLASADSPTSLAANAALATAELVDDNDEAAIAILRQLVQVDDLDVLNRSALASILALCLMAAGPTGPEANGLAHLSYGLTPWELHARAAEGIALIDSGDYESGLSLLDSVTATILKPTWQVRLHCARAQGHLAAGDAAIAKKALRAARKVGKDNPSIDNVAGLLQQHSTSAAGANLK